MRYILEHLAVAVCAITGVLAAKNKQVDLFGVVVLALVTAAGGGTLRDLVLGVRPFWIVDSTFVLNAVLVGIATFLVARLCEMPRPLLLVADAFGLALFTIVGAEKALALSGSNTVAVVLGVVTGVAGGMIRDVLTGEVPLVLRTGIYLYATAALCGASVFVLVAPNVPSPVVGQSIGVVITLGLRLAAIRWRLRLPEFQERSATEPARLATKADGEV
jgi:uncharacterized membrane protein YeiH